MPRYSKLQKDTIADRLFAFMLYVFLSFCLIMVLYPLIYVLSASISAPSSVINGDVWLWPVKPTLLAYKAVFNHRLIISGFYNSFFYMIIGTVINLIFTILAAYPLSRREFSGKGIVTAIFVFTMYFSGGLVPTYLLINQLGLVNTRAVMIIPVAMSVWNMVICRTFLQNTIPDELFQAAQLDGCGEARFLLSVVLPLSKPVMAVLALYYGIGHWNSYFNAMIYLSSQSLFPLQLVLRSILVMGNMNLAEASGSIDVIALQQQQGYSTLLKYAVIVVASVPVMLLYPLVQKYFVKGIMLGSLKG